MNYTKKAVSGSFFIFAALILSNLIAYFTRAIMTRNLTIEEYGLFYAVLNFVILFLIFRDMGLNTSLAKFIPDLKIQKKFNKLKTVMYSVISIQLFSSIILSLFFYLSAGFLAEHYFKNPNAEFLLKFFIIYIFFSIFFRFIKASMVGFKKFGLSSMMDIMRNFFVFFLVIILFRLGYGIFAPVYSYILMIILVVLISLFFFFSSFNPFRYKILDFINISKETSVFGLSMFLAAIGGQVIGYMDSIMLTYYTDLSTVGIYNVILPTALIFLVFGMGIGTVMTPLISELYSKKDNKRINEGIRMLYKYSFAVALPLIAVAFSFPKFLLSFFFGGEYAQGTIPFMILLVGVLFFLVGQINSSILVGLGKPKIVTKIMLVAALLNIVLNAVLIPIIGIVGAALATSASYILILIMSTLSIRKHINIDSPLKKWSLIFISGLIYIFLISFLKNILNLQVWPEIFISTGISSLAYLGLLFLFKIIDLKEIRKYLNLFLHKKSKY